MTVGDVSGVTPEIQLGVIAEFLSPVRYVYFGSGVYPTIL